MDFQILKALSNRQRYTGLVNFVPQGMVTPETRAMLQWFQVYYSSYPEHQDVQVEALKSLIQLRSQGANPDSIKVTLHYCDLLARPINDADLRGVLGTLYELDFAGKAGAVLASYERGEDVDVVHELESLARQAKRARANGKSSDYIDTSITDILDAVANDVGIKFRNDPLLFEHISAIQGGVSVALGARPDKGKTSKIASFTTDFAPQCVDFFGGDRPILWLNNEGSGKRIIPRIYQAALGMTLPEIIELSNQGKLIAAYQDAIGAPADFIRVKDIHGSNLAQIEQVIEDMRPSVVVLDMIANVRHHTAAGANKADAVEGVWQEWRELTVRHDFIGLATVQISQEGGNMLFPPYSALKDSKTGIQGATDIIIMLGSLDKPELAHIRGVSTPKNKFAVPGKQSYATGEQHFDGSRCVFNSGESNATVPATQPLASMG